MFAASEEAQPIAMEIAHATPQPSAMLIRLAIG